VKLSLPLLTGLKVGNESRSYPSSDRDPRACPRSNYRHIVTSVNTTVLAKCLEIRLPSAMLFQVRPHGMHLSGAR
jgi:hypothetical protein